MPLHESECHITRREYSRAAILNFDNATVVADTAGFAEYLADGFISFRSS